MRLDPLGRNIKTCGPRLREVPGSDETPNRRGRSYLAVLAILIVAASLSACSSKSEKSVESPKKPSKKVDYSKCDISAPEHQSVVACQDELFLTAVRAGDFKDLEKISDSTLASYARGLCAYASTLKDSDKSLLPNFGDLVASTATSWDIDVEQVEAVYRATRLLCPDDYLLLKSLPRSATALQLEIIAMGTGTADIVYLLPGGASERIEAETLPWSQVLNVNEPSTMSISVTPQEGSTAGCQIRQNHTVIKEERISSGRAECAVSAADIDRQVISGRKGGS